MLTPGDVPTLLARGGDPSYVDADGDTPLSMALYWEEHDIALALIEAGADLSIGIDGGSVLEQALYNDADQRVVEALLERGALERAELDGFDAGRFLADHADGIDDGVAERLRRHRRTVQSGL